MKYSGMALIVKLCFTLYMVSIVLFLFFLCKKLRKKIKLLLLLTLHLMGLLGIIGYVHYSLTETINKIKKGNFYQIENITFIKDQKQNLLGKIGHKCREYIDISQVPGLIIETLISTEDKGFFTHQGISLQNTFYNIFKALFTNYKVVGASTITQQVARNVFLTNRVSFTRKIKEVWIAQIGRAHV